MMLKNALLFFLIVLYSAAGFSEPACVSLFAKIPVQDNLEQQETGAELYLKVKKLWQRPISTSQMQIFKKRWDSLDKKINLPFWEQPLSVQRAMNDQRMKPSRTLEGKQKNKLGINSDIVGRENWFQAMRYVNELARSHKDLNAESIQQINVLLNKNLRTTIEPGKFRDLKKMNLYAQSEPMKKFVDGEVVPWAMHDFFNWYNVNKKTAHPIFLAAKAYERLVSIHPFTDGNGRTARLVMDWILMRNGYMPAAVASDWDSTKVAQFGRLENSNSAPSFVVEIVTAGLERSYSFLQNPVEWQGQLRSKNQ